MDYVSFQSYAIGMHLIFALGHYTLKEIEFSLYATKYTEKYIVIFAQSRLFIVRILLENSRLFKIHYSEKLAEPSADNLATQFVIVDVCGLKTLYTIFNQTVP